VFQIKSILGLKAVIKVVFVLG
jgi:hypothetical protein